MCGEHRNEIRVRADGRGSSPHVRGTLISWTLQVASMGIIPACAGNTSSSIRSSSFARDHPRMCGEHVSACRFRFVL